MSFRRKDLLANGDADHYDPPMTDAELWAAVGAFLKKTREERKYGSTLAASIAPPQHGRRPPNVQTIRAIERGQPKTLAVLSDYCGFLGLRMSYVLATVLPQSKVSAEAMRLAKAYDAVQEWPELRALAEQILQLQKAPRTPASTETDARAKGHGRSGRGR